MDNPNTFTLGEVAHRAGVSYKTIKRWYLAGKVPAPNRDRNNRPAFTSAGVSAIVRFAFQLRPRSARQRSAHYV